MSHSPIVDIALKRISELRENWIGSRHYTRGLIVQTLITNIRIVAEHGSLDDIEFLFVMIDKFDLKLVKALGDDLGLVLAKIKRHPSSPINIQKIH